MPARETYMILTPADQMALLRPRIENAERRHYELTLNVKTATTGSVEAAEKELSTLQPVLEWLRSENTRIETNTDEDITPVPPA